MDVVGDGKAAPGSTSKRESGVSEPTGSDKESDNDDKVRNFTIYTSMFWIILLFSVNYNNKISEIGILNLH